MAMTIQEVEALVQEIGLKYGNEEGTLMLGCGTKTYTNADGRKVLFMGIGLWEGGEYIRIEAPHALKAAGPHVDAFLKACMMAQWRTKLIQFEYDEEDGEIRAVVEFPLEDGKITAKQLGRCLMGLVSLLDGLYPTLKRALDEGVIDFPEVKRSSRTREIEAIESLIASIEAQSSPDRSFLEVLRAKRAALVAADEGPPTAV
jgi:hypothetical protein